MKALNKKYGFTLIELSLVLVIIGILLAIGLVAFKVLIQQAKFKQTKDTVNTACEAVKGYAERNYRLPSTSEFTTLGIPTKDAYNQNLIYSPATALASDNICTTTSTALLNVDIYDDCSGSPTTKNDVAFVVYSIGENRLDQTASGSTFTIYPGNCNVNGKVYDDIACFYDINALRSEVCPPPLTIDTSDLPTTAFEDTYYEGTVKGDGGFPPYVVSTSPATLPCGLQLSGNKIYGTVNCENLANGTLSTCSSTASFTITLSDTPTVPPSSSVSTNFTLTIKPQTPKVVETSLPQAQEGVPYSVSLNAIGGDGNYTWTISGSLPTGLSASGNTISGTPSTGTAGTYTITATVESCSESSSTVLSLVVNPQLSSGGGSGGTCSSYNVRILESSWSGSDYIRGIFVNGSCTSSYQSRKDSNFTGVTNTTVYLYTSGTCSGTPAETYDLTTIDTDNDCNVYISCSGDNDTCKIYNNPTVYCPVASFGLTGTAAAFRYGSTSGFCTYFATFTVPIGIYVYTTWYCAIWSLQCKYYFSQEFQISENSSLDCRVWIDQNCSIYD